jgi:hypothetical protein
MDCLSAIVPAEPTRVHAARPQRGWIFGRPPPGVDDLVEALAFISTTRSPPLAVVEVSADLHMSERRERRRRSCPLPLDSP